LEIVVFEEDWLEILGLTLVYAWIAAVPRSFKDEPGRAEAVAPRATRIGRERRIAKEVIN
jgi:hypothetical protein